MRKHKSFFAGCCAWLVLSGTNAAAQSIHQLVAESGGAPVSRVLRVDTPAHSPEDMVSDSDLIVIGKLSRARSYVSANDAYILTDYVLTINRVILNKTAQPTLPVPGTPPPATVTLQGGEVTIDGVRVTMTDSSRSPWTEHTPLLLFLVCNRDGKCQPYAGSSGMFRIGQDGRIKAMRQQGSRDPKVEDATLADILQRIERVQRSKRPLKNPSV